MFNNFFDIDKSISKNKAFNISLILDTDQIIIGVKVLKERKRDHARIGLIIHLVILVVEVCIYDKRHWLEDRNRWSTQDDQYAAVTL